MPKTGCWWVGEHRAVPKPTSAAWSNPVTSPAGTRGSGVTQATNETYALRVCLEHQELALNRDTHKGI